MSRGELRAARWVAAQRHPLTKVPEVTAYFWITKVLTTGMGEATSDYLVHRFNPEIAVVVGFTAFVAAMALQFSVRRYNSWIYWLAVVMVAVFGTMAADVLHVGLGIPYAVSTAFFAVVLAVIFVLWYRSERTLSIHSIYTRRRELFYWATVLATFALGTAAGDLTAKVVGLGYLVSGVMFAVVIAEPVRGVPVVRAEPHRGLLVRLHRHPAAGRLIRRLAGVAAERGWPRARPRHGQPGVDVHHHRPRWLHGGYPQGRHGGEPGRRPSAVGRSAGGRGPSARAVRPGRPGPAGQPPRPGRAPVRGLARLTGRSSPGGTAARTEATGRTAVAVPRSM